MAYKDLEKKKAKQAELYQKNKEHMEHIFKISDEFYEEYKDSTEYITKEMFNVFQTM